ncbi:MAG: ATP-binding cassette domain-containing protein [Clostridiales bacterium]|nr:ATP-binding cassette domain-containing protein [Clostridiales bacterium]
MLSAEKISKRYNNNRRQILDSIDLTLDEGEFVAIMGESGSGKSTLLAILAGILLPEEGQVLFDGKDLYSLSDAELSEVHRKKIGYVPQSNFFLKNYTILENIVEPFVNTNDADPEELSEKALAHLDRLGIKDLADRYPHELSGGEQKRVALVRALLTDPRLLIADEPTTGLDSETGKIILQYLSDYVASGHSVLVATHDEHVKEYAGRVLDITKI